MALASTSDIRVALGISAPRSLSLCTPPLGSGPRPRRTLAPAGRSRRVCRAEEGSLSDLVNRRQQQGKDSGSGETAKRSGGKQQGKGKRSGSVSSGGGKAEAKGAGDGGHGLENGGEDGDEDSGVKVVSVKQGGDGKKAVFEDVGSIYDNPEIYDMAFSFRDMEKEADFLYDSYETLKGGATPSVFLELGMEMADSGLQVYAVDINAAMLEYARAEWNAVGEVLEEAGDDELPSMTIVEGDMRTYALPEGVQADMCGILCGTFNHLLTLEDAQQCLRSCHRNLKEGGLLVIEMVHPDLLFDGSTTGQGDTWQLELEDGVQLEMWYGSEQDRFDALTQVLERNVVVEVNRQGKLLRAHSVVHQRQYCLGELELLAGICGFKVAAGFGELDLQVPLRNDNPNYMVLVLERLPDSS